MRSAARETSINSFMATSISLSLSLSGRSELLNASTASLLLPAQGRPRHVDRDVAATDHHYFLADREAIAEIDIEQEVDSLDHSVQFVAGNLQIAAAMQAERQQYRLVALRAQVRTSEKSRPEARVQPQFRPEIEDFADLRLQDVARQAVLGNPEMHHAARAPAPPRRR